jgi:CxxC-x17-CxxC domain-containing protein
VAVMGATIPRHQVSPRTETQAVCAQCGKETTLPFRPTQGRPVLCRECFQQRRSIASA